MKETYSESTQISSSLKSLLENISHDKEHFEGEQLFQEGQNADKIYIVSSGKIKISKTNINGKELTLRFCQKDSIFGEFNLFDDMPSYYSSAQSIENGIIQVIYKSELEHHLKTDPEFSYEFIKWMNSRSVAAQYKMKDLLLFGKKGALCSIFIRLAHSFGLPQSNGSILIDYILTDQILASFIAATRETANRIMGDLKKHQVISIDESGRILIHNFAYLQAQVDCENCPIDRCTID